MPADCCRSTSRSVRPSHRERSIWTLTPTGMSRAGWESELPLSNVYCALKPVWLFVVDEVLQFAPKLLSRSVAATGVLRQIEVRDLITHRYGLTRPTGFEAVFLRPDRRLGRILEHADLGPSAPSHSEFALHYLLAMGIETATGRDARQWCGSVGRRLLGDDVLIDARSLRGSSLAGWAGRTRLRGYEMWTARHSAVATTRWDCSSPTWTVLFLAAMRRFAGRRTWWPQPGNS